MPRPTFTTLLALLFFAFPLGAHAQTPAPAAAAAPATVTAEGAQEVVVIPPAANALGGHLQLAVGPLVALPFAELDSATNFRDQAGTGFGAGADIGIGVSRNLALGAFGQYVVYGDGNDCTSCDARSFAVGAFVRYHLVQGMRFDPWASLGVGFRKLDAGDQRDYSGVDWLRLQFGGDWYLLSQLGFGPFAELDLGTFTDRPGGTDASVYASALVGLRLIVDVQGK